MLAKDRKALIAAMRNFTTYSDVIALALARSNLTRLSTNTHVWQKALFEICERYREAIPELRAIRFEMQPPLPPQSDEAHELTGTLSIGGLLGLLVSGGNSCFVMDPKQKTLVRRQEEQRLAHYREHIPDISKILEKHLTVGMREGGNRYRKGN